MISLRMIDWTIDKREVDAEENLVMISAPLHTHLSPRWGQGQGLKIQALFFYFYIFCSDDMQSLNLKLTTS